MSAVITAIKGLDVEIILVDDSPGGTLQIPQDNIKVVRSFGSGASNARNLGYKHASGKLLLFIDDDIIIKDSHIHKTLELHSTSVNAAYNFYWQYPEELNQRLGNFKFGKYILYYGLNSNQYRLQQPYEKISERSSHNGLTSQYFSIEKKWLDLVKGYESYPYAGVEDLVLYKKLKSIGVEVYLIKNEVVLHNEENRLNIKSLFNRYRTGALTHKIAFIRGYADLGYTFTSIDLKKGELGIKLLPLLLRLEKIIPYSLLYRKIVNYILFTGSYLGYCKDKIPEGY